MRYESTLSRYGVKERREKEARPENRRSDATWTELLRDNRLRGELEGIGESEPDGGGGGNGSSCGRVGL